MGPFFQEAGWLVAGLVGVLVGALPTLAFCRTERVQKTVPAGREPVVDDGVVRVLAVLRSAAVVVDDDSAVLRATPAAYALGLVRDGALVHAPVRRLVDEVRTDGVIRDAELDLPRGPMGPATLRVSVRVAQVAPGMVAVLADDLTQARRVEAIRRDFVANVSHELKTPVGALALLAEAVGQAPDDAEAVRRFAGRMTDETTRLSRLVHEIIELSRLQVATTDALSLVEVDEVVAEAADAVATAAAARNVRLAVGPPTGLCVTGDRQMLVTAVRNLVDNAVAYSSDGTSVSISVRPARTDEGVDVVEVVVVDEGVGIPPDLHDRVFERFFRVDPARSRDTGGTGLGLSIVKHVAADHGGDVIVWSQPGRGSTFTIRVPKADTHTPAGATPRKAGP
ncbi:MAG: ATP-binding protein [Micrococcales bacterium]|nr:ATP-binding protein [Micrococcales bacterium]MCL2668564.1 ATP-binding protein [Micrococcales bacterium]